ncbi:hypothetical protein KVR01_006119 [Diaporthe batatas]|uniref:uncharacterized protein n=1 Tax=Diaporthe batatas TaxID=748121 RepID=UPI001D036B69|nr:uncharacterized protein KVR01_006119 [Diaporthe batatas]KAG8164201.1 hypothetical protein KVR01_006119 [Diaporthe batatas]
MPGAIALAAIFMLMLIEMAFHPARRHPEVSGDTGGVREDTAARTNTATHPATMRPIIGRSSSIGRRLSRIDRPDEERQISAERIQREEKQRRDMMHCVMLEAGILFHSIFIGMALSVSINNEFVVLLIAIAFHQTFEGLALGSRIADIGWHEKAWKPWLMALAYGCTTPLGQAIGLATHSFYNQDSEVGLLVVGCMNAISAGLLTFQSLVELLSEDFLSDSSWQVLRGRRRFYACVHVFMGAFVMSLVGAWA